MHGMLSDVTYQRLAGTNVLTDFVELPSQLFEHWLSQPAVLKKHVSCTHIIMYHSSHSVHTEYLYFHLLSLLYMVRPVMW